MSGSESNKNIAKCGCEFTIVNGLDGERVVLTQPCSAAHTPMEDLSQFGFARDPIHSGQEPKQQRVLANWS